MYILIFFLLINFYGSSILLIEYSLIKKSSNAFSAFSGSLKYRTCIQLYRHEEWKKDKNSFYINGWPKYTFYDEGDKEAKAVMAKYLKDDGNTKVKLRDRRRQDFKKNC